MPVRLLMNIQNNTSYLVGSLVSARNVFDVMGRCESKRRWIEQGNNPDEWVPKFLVLHVTDLALGSSEYTPLKANFETGRPIRFINLTGEQLDSIYPNWRDYYEINEKWSVISKHISEVI